MRRDARDDQHVAVGGRFGDELRADDAAGAALILDDEALLQLLGELPGDEPPRCRGTGRTEGHDDLYGREG